MTNLNQNGRSMIEMLGVLAIIGVLSVGGIAGYSKAMMKFKTNKTIDQIAMTVTNIRTLYAQQPNYDLTDAEAYSMGVIDDAMKNNDAGTQLKNAFNGRVYISPAKSGAVGESGTGAFVVTFAGLPREACVNIATNDWGSNYSSGLLGIGAGHGTLSAAQNINCYVVGGNGGTGDTGALGSGSAVTTETEGYDKDTNPARNAMQVSCSAAGPFRVDQAATGCDCEDNDCFVSFKYY